MRAKVKRGEFHGTAPTGYQNDVRKKSIIIDRKKWKIIKEAFELYALGNSRLENIGNFLLYQKGVKSLEGDRFHKDRVKYILSNPFYYGHFYYAGEVHEGKHTPLVSKKLFDKVQEVIKERGHPMKPRNEPKSFCGLLHCGTCGMMMTAEDRVKIQKNGNVHNYSYYRCSKKYKIVECNEPQIRKEELLDQVSEILAKYAMPSPWAKEFNYVNEKI